MSREQILMADIMVDKALAQKLNEAFVDEVSVVMETKFGMRPEKYERILEAMKRVPRHEHIHPRYYANPYQDRVVSWEDWISSETSLNVFMLAQVLAQDTWDKSFLDIGAGGGFVSRLAMELGYSQVVVVELDSEQVRHMKGLFGRESPVKPLRRNIFTVDFAKVLGEEFAGFDSIFVGALVGNPWKLKHLIGLLASEGSMVVPVKWKVLENMFPQVLDGLSFPQVYPDLGVLSVVRRVGDEVMVNHTGWSVNFVDLR